jgi:hypothetical protein
MKDDHQPVDTAPTDHANRAGMSDTGDALDRSVTRIHPYVLIARQMSDGTDEMSCEWRGKAYSARTRAGASCAVARLLVEAGAPDGAWVICGTDGKPRLCGSSLHYWATRTINESNSTGLKVRKFRPRTPLAEAA